MKNYKIEFIIILISIIILLFSLFIDINIINFYFLFIFILISFIILFYQVLKRIQVVELNKIKYYKLSYENPYFRKKAMVESALKGSYISRVVIGEIIKEAYERKLGRKINVEIAKIAGLSQEEISIIFYSEHGKYFKDNKQYIRALEKTIKQVLI